MRRALTLIIFVLFSLTAFLFAVANDPVFQVDLEAARFHGNPDYSNFRRLLVSIARLEGYDITLLDKNLNAIEILSEFESRFEELDSKSMLSLTKVRLISHVLSDRNIPFATQTSNDPKFVEGERYFVRPGAYGKESVLAVKLKIYDNELPVIAYPLRYLSNPETALVALGEKPVASVENDLKAKFDSLKAALNDQNGSTYEQLVSDAAIQPLLSIKSVANFNYKFERLAYKSFVLKVTQENGVLKVGDLLLTQTDCATELRLPVVYDANKQEYFFSDVRQVFENGCNPASSGGVFVPRNVTALTCADCWLAPVDKSHQLNANYIPANLVSLGVPGGGVMTADSAAAMTNMYNDALSQGINFQAISSYRSFQTQQSTFEYWVGIEMSYGYDRATAEIRANVYSAKPGHSEHQLGTTADLSCVGCTAFDNSAGNVAVYNYLANNAHRFGFVISYPPNTQHLTGYTYEPWHVRYIGIDLATQFYGTGYTNGNGNYLAQFLLQLGQY